MRRLRSSSIKSRGVAFLALLVCFLGLPAFGQPWDGNGVEGDPYQIWDACDMQAIGADSNCWNKHFKLMEDIDLGGFAGAEYNIIGNWDTPFRGVFDGNGHRIYNFTYDSNVVNYIGLFWYVDDPNSEIKNLGLIDPNIDGPGGTVSSLVVRLKNGTVTDCYVEGGRISGLGSAGGLVGSLDGHGGTATVSNCHASVNVSGGGSNVGGLVGSNAEATISNCYSTGSVTGNGYRAGGLVGTNWVGGTIANCHSTCAVSGDLYVGGLVGDNYDSAHISNSSATGNVTGTGKFIGGLVGANHSDSTISGCYAAGDVNGRDGGRVGGLVGVNTSDILNSYANGSVSSGLDVGGLVGENDGTIANCYSAGSVSGYNIGGLVGDDDSGSYTRCFWDSDVNPDVNGIGNGSNPEVIGESTTNMQMAVTFAGWGCEPVWTIDDGNDYPRLAWEDAPGLPLSGYLYAGGSGEANDPFLIETGEQLNRIGLSECSWVKHFRLIADIDLSAYTGDSFNIIGRYVGPDDPNNKPFTGVFDGDGHTISNFTYSSDGNDLIAIFAYIDDVNAEIKNLGLIDPNIDTGTGLGIGALAGWTNDGTVRDCYVEGGSVSGGDAVGGLVGYHGAWGLITECYASSNVSGTSRVGGLVGGNNAVISNCYSSGEVSGDIDIGGLVGDTFYGAWTGPGAILNSYSKASVSGEEYVGGLAGCNAGYISKCYSVGSVSGDDWVGGLVGFGGGGIDSFWDVNSSGQASSSGGTPKTTAEMQTESTFTDAGWDFVGESINGTEDIWDICEGEDYPRLAWEKYGGGNGTEANPYLIRTSCQMNAIGADANYWDAHFKLMADIDLSAYTGTSFNIIGLNSTTPFSGVFDGNGHTVSNLTYNSTGTNYIGIFGYVDDPNAEIKNLGLIDPNVDAGTGDSVGSLVGQLQKGSVTDCNSVGGSVTGDWFVGGLMGYNRGMVRNSYATGSVSGDSRVGGLVGLNDSGTVSNSYATASVSGSGGGIGGLVGYDRFGTVSNSYAAGSVSGDNIVGGLVGHNDGTVSNSYATSSVSGNYGVGGLVGWDDGWGDYIKSFWDSTVTPDVNGIGNGADPDVIGETTANMQTESTFTDAGWDFVGEVINGPNDIWDICEGTNYPRFVWQIPAADFVCPDGVNFIDYAFFAKHWLQAIYGDCGEVELTGDGKVNWVDFALFAEYWKLTGCGECGGADFTGDENVDLADLSVFATYWLGFEYAEVDLTNDGKVGLDDLREFTENWLAGM